MRYVAVQKRQRRDAERMAPVCEKRSASEWPLAVRVALICYLIYDSFPSIAGLLASEWLLFL